MWATRNRSVTGYRPGLRKKNLGRNNFKCATFFVCTIFSALLPNGSLFDNLLCLTNHYDRGWFNECHIMVLSWQMAIKFKKQFRLMDYFGSDAIMCSRNLIRCYLESWKINFTSDNLKLPFLIGTLPFFFVALLFFFAYVRLMHHLWCKITRAHFWLFIGICWNWSIKSLGVRIVKKI